MNQSRQLNMDRLAKWMKLGPIAVVAVLVILGTYFRDQLTLNYIVDKISSHPSVSVLILLAMYAVKALSFVFPVVLLYVSSGLIFPPPEAIVVNLLGIWIASTLTYCIGRYYGPSVVGKIYHRYPKLKRLLHLQNENELLFSLVLRISGVVPMELGAIFLGALGFGYHPYILGSMLGLLPSMLAFTLLGTTISDPASPGFAVALTASILISCGTGVFYHCYLKNKAGDEDDEGAMNSLETAAKGHKKTPGTLRVVIVFLALLLQVLLLAYIVNLLQRNTVYIYFLLEVAGAVVVTVIVAKNRNPSYTIMWLIIMMILPVLGYLLFLLWGTTGLTLRKSRVFQANIAYSRALLKQDPQVFDEFLYQHPSRQRIGTYLRNKWFPIYKDTRCIYFPLGELQFSRLIEDIQKARKYIFMEYFIVAEGHLWNQIHDVLRQKAQQGVEVRILLDDLGSITKLSDTFVRDLRKEGIQALRFNPVHKHIFRLLINYRNHQKITVIDGNIGYTGGTNIADEYVNLTHKLGHWRDTAIRLEGAAVWSLTVTFLQMWDTETNLHSDYRHYMPAMQTDGTGFFQPFTDGPVNNPDNPAQDVYVQIISEAQRYVYITTPYLVIDNALLDTLCTAARSGIDVRIVTPKRWDHWYVHIVTQSNYDDLLAAGVKIYEYTPGFIHAKIILSDDDNGVIGSINMDYRSFYFLFENGVWICGAPVLQDIKTDLMDIFSISEEIKLESWTNRPRHKKFIEDILRLFAPLF